MRADGYVPTEADRRRLRAMDRLARETGVLTPLRVSRALGVSYGEASHLLCLREGRPVGLAYVWGQEGRSVRKQTETTGGDAAERT